MDLSRCIVCRCEGVTLGAIREAIHYWGAGSHHEVKLIARAGKGVCQGRTCSAMVAQIVADEIGIPVGELALPSVRPPVRPITLASLRHPDPRPAQAQDEANTLTMLTLAEARHGPDEI